MLLASMHVTPMAYAEAENGCIRIYAEGKILHDLTIHLPKGADLDKARQAALALTNVFASGKQKEFAL